MDAAKMPYLYEMLRIQYKPAGTLRSYKPDFVVANGILIEAKGLFSAADRTKHLLVRQQHPTYDIRFVFQNANAKLSKKSKTTYAMWCEHNGFLYAHKTIPAEWLVEKATK
jgi:Autographiviridae endonuclease I